MNNDADDVRLRAVLELLRGRLTLPVTEAAALLGMGRATLYAAIERGEVPNAGFPGKGRVKRVPTWWLLKQLSPPNGG